MPDARGSLASDLPSPGAPSSKADTDRGALKSSVDSVTSLDLGSSADLPQDAVDRGFEVGFREGFERGQSTADAKIREAADKVVADIVLAGRERLARMDAILDQLPQKVSQYFADTEEDAIAVAFEAVCNLLSESASSKDVLERLVQKTLSEWQGRAPFALHLHPDDFELMRDSDGYSPVSGERRAFKMMPDSRIEIGGCVLQSDEGGLDARLEVQLENLKVTMVELRNQRVASVTSVQGILP